MNTGSFAADIPNEILFADLFIAVYAGLYRQILLEHLTTPNVDVHTLFRRVGKAVFTATGGKQSPVCPGQ